MKCFGCKIFVGWYEITIGIVVFAKSEEEVKPLVMKALIEYVGKDPEMASDKVNDYVKDLYEGNDPHYGAPAEVFEISMEPNTIIMLGAEDYSQYWY